MRFVIVFLLVTCFAVAIFAKPGKTAQTPSCSRDCGEKYEPVCAKAKNGSKERLLTFGNECVMGNYNCQHSDDPKAAFMASSANIEQCNFTGGSRNSLAISVFLSLPASSTVFPLTHSVANELLAMAEPQPNVLNFASIILPFSSTLICNFMTSPQAGAPTKPVPTVASFLSKDPTLRGFS
uniref:Kazal-like domain-containing protein n=1 Tax=Glossina palpalis gambiensis TaxID=67801 RepID=A0A1B0C5K0_9MUSC